jgi:beta-N-acetylhexosaminidase
MNSQDMSKQLGQLFVIGFQGTTPSNTFLNFIQEEHIGGVILFGENCQSHLIARQNIEQIRSNCSTLPFIAVDQEGGRVCRLKGAPIEFKAASYYSQQNRFEQYQEDYKRAAVYMETLGFNLNLAPVADIFLDPENSCLQDRCFGNTPEVVARFVRASVIVAKSAGMLSCLKHFPGLGAAKNDPHKQTSVANYDMMIWQQREKIPFSAGIDAGADVIMTTHVHLPKLDNHIATVSPYVISQMIRGDLGFDGPVITDDLCMQGIFSLGDVGERAVSAFNAGHDLLLFGQDSDAAMKAYDYFCEAFRRKEIDPIRIKNSLDRIAGIKFKLGRTVLR